MSGTGTMPGGLPPAVVWPLAIALAAILGSFLNVCISRLPRGQSVVLPPSHCPRCRVPIRPCDNIPLVSFAILRGRCRGCGTAISWRYPVVEALAVLVGVAVLWSLGPTWEALRIFAFSLVLVVVTFTDVETRRIPDRVTLPGIVVALALPPEGVTRGTLGALVGALLFALIQRRRADAAPARGSSAPDDDEEVDPAEQRRLDTLWAAAWGALAGRQAAVVAPGALAGAPGSIGWRIVEQVDPWVLGCLLAGGLFFLVAWLGHAAFGRTGMGGGDIKLAALMGAVLGPAGVLVAVFLGIMVGGVGAAVLLALRQRRFGEYVSFGPFLALGGFVAALWGRPLLEWYLG